MVSPSFLPNPLPRRNIAFLEKIDIFISQLKT